MPGLRERRHAETKQAIRDAAFALFDKVGFGATTMDQIADRSGVSRSTLYRRFANKDEIVLAVANEWLASWDGAVAAVESDAPLGHVIAEGCLAVAHSIDDSRELVLASYRALRESPSLQVAGAATTGWLNRFVDLVASKEPALDAVEVRTIAGAYLGAIDTMMLDWAEHDGATSIVDSTRRIMDRLAPILP